MTAYSSTGETPATTSLICRNPLRYRGYIYDTETGFYYLQSRYYDPANHRFINADALASTGQGFVGTNMFAYCLNNPVIFVDTEGTDAVIVIDEDGAAGFGHVNLFVQNGSGSWQYYSFASSNSYLTTAMVSLFSDGVDGALTHRIIGSADGYDLMSFNGFKAFITDSGQVEHTALEMDHAIYLSGDFSETYLACQFYAENGAPKYDLFSYNCMDFAMNMLLQSPDALTESQQKAIAGVWLWGAIPNANIKGMKKIGRELK